MLATHEDVQRGMESQRIAFGHEDSDVVLWTFKAQGALPMDATHTRVISTSNARMLMRALGAPEECVQEFKEASQPPPAYMPPEGSGEDRASGGDRAMPPGVPLPGPVPELHPAVRPIPPRVPRAPRIVAAAAPDILPPDEFPSTIPVMNLEDDGEVPWVYGLGEGDISVRLDMEFRSLYEWCTDRFQMKRGAEYAAAVQEVTMHGMLSGIKGYLGFCAGDYGPRLPVASLKLDLYTQPIHFAQFLGYLVARHVRRESLIRHVSVAKKVTYYLRSCLKDGSDRWLYLGRLRAWLTTVEAQVSLVMPGPEPKVLPEFANVISWVDDMTAMAKEAVVADMSAYSCISLETAYMVSFGCCCQVIVTLLGVPPCLI